MPRQPLGIDKSVAIPGTVAGGKLRIEKNIPIPPLSRGGDERFPWLDMEPGDSFFVTTDYEDDKPTIDNFVKRMSARAQNASKKHHTKYLVRRMKQGEIEGVRVWRIAPKPEGRSNGRH